VESGEYYFLQPGGIYISSDPMLIHTVLGSCVSVCIWDVKSGIGGMNHYIYHHAMLNMRNCRYGDIAIPHLIRLLCEMGGDKKNFIAHIVGGAHSLIPGSIVGSENVRVANEILYKYHIAIDKVDVGGERFRKVIFNNRSGEITVKRGEGKND
jgi:chemotaxis protein CheD